MRRHAILTILSLFFLCTGACSKNSLHTEYVAGTVTLDGVPVGGVRVFFNPKEGGVPAIGLTDSNGRFVITAMQGGGQGKGTVEGEYFVTFSKPQSVPVEGKPDQYETKHLLPLVYFEPKQTPFSATVVKGKNEFVFDLKSDPDIEFKPPPGYLESLKQKPRQ